MWSITNLKYRTEDGIAIKVAAKYELTSSNITTFNTIWVNLPEPTENIIPFEQLTEQEVLNWVFSIYDTTSVEIKVAEEHNILVNAPIHERLPWIS